MKNLPNFFQNDEDQPNSEGTSYFIINEEVRQTLVSIKNAVIEMALFLIGFTAIVLLFEALVG